MSSETIPEWAYAQAIEFVANLTDSLVQAEQVEPIALALLTAEQRGRKAGLEEAAKVALTRSPDDDNLDWQVRQQVAAAIRSLGEKT